MMHVRTIALPAATAVQAAIAAHRTAYDAFQVAPDGDASVYAETAYDDASMALVTAVCVTGPDAAFNEIKRRKPADLCDLEIRLRVLAPMVIANGDKLETAAFARELLAFAER